jgi:hypothetical protein
MEWAGVPHVHSDGHIERSISIPEEAYRAIEGELRKGGVQGVVTLPTGARFDWFLHGALPRRTNGDGGPKDRP